MNRLFRLPLVAATLFVLSACGEDQQAKQRADLRTDIERVHDQAMAQQSRLRQLRDIMAVRLDSLRTTKDTTVIQGQMSDILKAQGALTGAMESMDRWMESYDADSAGMETADGTGYLVRQKGFVDALQQSMNHALADGEAVAERYNLPIPPAVVRVESDSASHSGH